MKVLILGGAGYIGSVLTNYLKEKGDEVVIYDNFLYDKDSDIHSDILDINALVPAIQNSEAVVNLAGLSNDPTSDIKPEVTWKMNYLANQTITDLLKSSGKRVVYASSCSVYGFGDKEFNELSKLHPVTLYARTKMLSEPLYLQKDMNSIVLRFATVYGMSPNPRLDLVVNTMIATAHFEKVVRVNGGNQWRPVIHVKDVAQAIWRSLHNINNKVYNVGSNEQNYLISDLGEIISTSMGVDLALNTDSPDNRSYKVNFDKIKELGFEPLYDVYYAIDEFNEAFKNGVIKNMTDDKYFRINYLKKYVSF